MYSVNLKIKHQLGTLIKLSDYSLTKPLLVELRNEQGSKASLVADLGVMKGQLNQAQSEAEQQSIALTKCLQVG